MNGFRNLIGQFDRNARALLRTALACLLTIAISGCATSNLPVMSAQSANSELTDGYRLASGDKVKVNVFDVTALTGEYQVGDGGVLSMPLIQPINVKGMTTLRLADAISQELKAGGYVLTPRVSVEIVEHRPFYILGEVEKPGEYPYSGELTLDQAIAMAGGFTARANKSVVRLKRADWPNARRIRLGDMALKIAPSDTITVEEAFF
ncbi:polysaccharide biosynthesis/export family protein [Novosphingobium sp. ZN18A2]|uniref:polysaccharide biosynthesis/export family protein n=1 Tax=Novosphingobium sp. ZN18A2 TaxID=3079861 RepID=UPI0030D5BA73